MTSDDLLRTGPIIKLEIGNPSDHARTATVNALIDTGAAFTAINPQLAQNCRLIQRSQKRIHVLGDLGQEDAKEYPEFSASIRFPEADLHPFRVVGIVACPIFERKFSCLLGRDILKYWEFTYSGQLGQFSIRETIEPKSRNLDKLSRSG
jgi:hypothetical protein